MGLALIAVILCGCGRNNAAGSGRSREEVHDLIILQTGRLRGNIYPESLRRGNPLQHYSKIAALVKATRQEAAATGAGVLLLDVGDSLSGSFAAHATRSENVIDFFNHVGYDAVALGNLDADLPLDVLGKLRMSVLTPFMDAGARPLPAGAVNGGIIGPKGFESFAFCNFYGDLDPATSPQRFPAWFGAGQCVKPYPVRNYASLFAKAEASGVPGPRIFTWMKFESPKVPPTKFFEDLKAGKVDVILAHRIYSGDVKDVWSSNALIDWEPPVAENILRENRGVTIVRTDLKREGDRWRVLSSRLISTNQIPSGTDPELTALIERHRPAIEAADAWVGKLPVALEKSDILEILLRCLTKIDDAEIVAYSPDSVRAGLPSGPLKVSQFFEVVPWSGPIAMLSLRPEEIDRALAASPIACLRRMNASPDTSGFLHLVTARYLAEVIRDRLGLPEDRLRLVEGSSEFGFFTETLSKNIDTIFKNPPEGWAPFSPVAESGK